jgi:hypothetical protein
MLQAITASLIRDEQGHAGPLPAIVVSAAGAVILGIGAAADDMGWLAVVGGVVLAVGIVGMTLLNHMMVEYDIFARLDTLEKK